MMQVCSLELAKQLKELGVKQESFFHWYVSNRSGYSFILESKKVNYAVDSMDTYDVYSAFTAGELGELMPDECFTWRVDVSIETGGRRWLCSRGDAYATHAKKADTEADARAKLLIAILQEGKQ